MSLLDILNNDRYRESTIPGVVGAIVTDNKDPEKLGRIKLKFPWLSNENETDWVRMATFMAGPDRGSFFLPEKGDEVLVAFDHGGIDRPYVIGALWNGKAKPPETNENGENNNREIKSRAGHKILFNDDEKGKKAKIEIQSKAGHKIILDDTAGQEGIKIQDKTGKNKISIDSVKNSLALECSGRLTLKAGNIVIEGKTHLTLKSIGEVEVKGLFIKLN